MNSQGFLKIRLRKQSECPKWFELRKPRITASNFGDICDKMGKRRAKPELLARDILQPKETSRYTERLFK